MVLFLKINEILQLDDTLGDRTWNLTACSAKENKGILLLSCFFIINNLGVKEGMQWFVENISKNK